MDITTIINTGSYGCYYNYKYWILQMLLQILILDLTDVTTIINTGSYGCYYNY